MVQDFKKKSIRGFKTQPHFFAVNHQTSGEMWRTIFLEQVRPSRQLGIPGCRTGGAIPLSPNLSSYRISIYLMRYVVEVETEVLLPS